MIMISNTDSTYLLMMIINNINNIDSTYSLIVVIDIIV
jgi:hypothetical protein